MIKTLAVLISFIIVAFGQPAFSVLLSIFASCFGYALFWWVVIKEPSAKKRFWYGSLWFACVQAVQLSWLLSHPFSYIYGLYFFLSAMMGLEFGVLSMLVTQERIKKYLNLLGLAGLYTIFEWLRLFAFSGFSFNPIGLALAGTLSGMQSASLVGVFGLTFIVLLTNLLVLRFARTGHSLAVVTGVVLAPYLFGFAHLAWHEEGVKKSTFQNVLLVQTAFPIEESIPFQTFHEAIGYVENEWKEIIAVLAKHQKRSIDMIVLPEYVVPYGTYVAIFPYENIKTIFEDAFGASIALPKLNKPLAMDGNVTNAYLCQAIADIFNADVVVGLQDDQWINDEDRLSYSSAFYFWPGGQAGFRYEKRVLLPMAEYIPFEPCKKLAAKYGITGSFVCGTDAKVFSGCKAPFGLSVCYEEMFGDLMRESRQNGSEMLVNVTSDIWYPNSKLPKQHFDHARLRTVEAGVPLVRACNTGITSAVNSIGDIIAQTKEDEEWARQGLLVQVPLYHYKTIYASLGDLLIIGLSAFFSLFLLRKS